MSYFRARRSPAARSLTLFVPVFLAVAALAAGAQPVDSPSPASDVIREADYLRPLLDDPRVAASLGEEIGRARAGITRARAFDDPEVALEREALDEADETVAAVGWRPPLPGRRALAVEAAEAELTAAEAAAAADLAALLADWRAAYAGWALAAARLEVLRSHHHRLAELSRRTAARAEAGEASGLDARRFDLAAGAVAAELATAQAESRAAEAAARAWRPDLPAGAAPVLPELPPAGPPPEAPGGPVAAAGGADGLANPRLAAAEAEVHSAELSRRLAEGVWRAPGITAGWKRVEPRTGAGDDGPVIGLSWSLPSPARRRAALAEALARSEAAGARAALLRARLLAETAAVRAEREGLAEAAAVARQALGAAAPATRAAEAAFAAGELDLTGLLDVLTAVREARLAALDLHARTLAADRRLSRLTGDPRLLRPTVAGPPTAPLSTPTPSDSPPDDPEGDLP